ncbi:uncharacterized protein IL334_002417 [Kwoniella shivajii]|uniref:MHYT domain-containing protein n=1 Tax=Kwoniella shivajii TaxID=564305 RepID=A0ABZ1CW04_9TREE|nr:hypothetical protein IL334_002417 [Kwoniella shivajii]
MFVQPSIAPKKQSTRSSSTTDVKGKGSCSMHTRSSSRITRSSSSSRCSSSSVNTPQPVMHSSSAYDHDSANNAVASSSRHTLPPKAIPSSSLATINRLPRSIRRRIGRLNIYFLLFLCYPSFTIANPLPQVLDALSQRRHSSRSSQSLTDHNQPMASTLKHGVSAFTHFASFILNRRDNNTDTPILAVAKYDHDAQAYTLPEGYVELNQRFSPGFIVLSYVIAFVGSLCTLELLVRRTTNSGWRNQLLLTSAGFCFGAVSTFAMHFVFNNALSLHHPLMDQNNYPALYLSYDPGFTVLSLVVSCLAMTTAFFVMGTQLRDWFIFPGQKKHKSRRRNGSSKLEADDYGKWKKSHKKVIRRGTLGVGALFAEASHIAKWSLIDVEASSGSKSSIKEKIDGLSGKSPKWKNESHKLDDPSGQNQDRTSDEEDLQELDFRLGKDAVRAELERRAGATTPTSTNASRSSLFRSPGSHTTLPVIYAPSSRRNSVASGYPEPSPDIFASNFNFPPRVEADPVQTSSSSFLPHQPVRSSSPTYDESPAPMFQPERRRASLPANVLIPHRERQSYSGPSMTLARIQSLPEGDFDPSTTSQGSIISTEEKKADTTPGTSVSARISSFASKNDATSERSTRKVRLVATSTRWTRLGMFLGFDVVTPTDILKIFITGTIAGLGVVGMHYIGQASITGLPYIAYMPGYVVGSIIIACGAVIIALYIMFIMLRPKLKHTWLSKICVALILAVAVTCMHFCGMMGTTYGWPVTRGISQHNKLTGTNVVITGIVSALAFSACIACAVFFVLHSLNLKRERARRRRVVVAAVFLDDRDRVLVNSTDGMLPMCDIASLSGGDVPDARKSFIQSVSSDSTVLGMDLTTGHDAFVSALKLSWTWKNPSLAATHPTVLTEGRVQASDSVLQSTFADIRRGSMVTTNTTATGNSRPPVSLTKFLERFTISSCQLAVRLLGQTDGISRLGVLYDQILTTGWVKLDNSNDTVSKGQLIFLVRRVASAAERMDLESRHFIFADPLAVATALHKTLSVPFDHTMPLLDDMRTFCDSTLQSPLQPGKLYAGVAVVQATPFDGLRILLEKEMRSQLPMRELCTLGVPSQDDNDLSGTVEEIGEALAILEGMTILSIMTRNMTNDSNQVLSKKVVALLAALERAIVPMLDENLTSEDMTHILPRLTLHPMLIPLTPGGSKRMISSYVPPHAIIFYATYDAAVNTFTDKWLPFSLFRAQNACVMAPKIAAAAKMDQLYTGSDNTINYPTGRRPSRVQFEFPQSTLPATMENETSIPTHVGAGGVSTEESNEMFSDFTFPPKSADSNTSPTKAQNGKPTSIINGNGVAAGAGIGIGARKSSLARSRFGSTGGESSSPSAYGDRDTVPFKTASLGVAVWEPEWLLHLLRSKLRADA